MIFQKYITVFGKVG